MELLALGANPYRWSDGLSTEKLSCTKEHLAPQLAVAARLPRVTRQLVRGAVAPPWERADPAR